MTIVYLIFIALAIYFSYRYDGIEEYDSHKNHRFWLLCIYLICISGFSYGLGGDKFAYMEDFEDLPSDMSYIDYARFSILFRGNMPGWSLLNMWVKRTFDSFYVLQFIQATIVNVAFCYTVKKHTHRHFLFLLLYFLTGDFFLFNTEVMREGISLAISLIALEQYFKGRRILFGILISCALLFHVSAFIMFLFPFVNFTINKRNIMVLLVLSFILWFLSDFVFTRLILLILGGQGALVQKAVHYSAMASTIFGYIRNTITFLFLPSIICLFYIQKYQKNYSKKNFLDMQHVLSFLLILAFIASALQGFWRFQNYTRIFYIIAFTEFTYELFRTKIHLISRFGVVFSTWVLIILSLFNYYPQTNFYFYQFYVPYTCILNENREVFFRKYAHFETTSKKDLDKGQRSVK